MLLARVLAGTDCGIFFAARRMIVQWEKGETVHMLQHHMPLGLAEIK